MLGCLAVGVPPSAAAAAVAPATSRVSVDSNGGQATEYRSEPFAVSADGRYVAFTTAAPNLVPDDTNNTWDVLVHDRRTGTTSRISASSAGVPGDSSSYGQAMSPDGRYVSFTSDATNLVPGDTNGAYDGFVHDRSTGTTSRVTVTDGGTQATARSYAPAISADARFVAFVSDATDLVPGDTNGVADIFLRDRRAGTTVLVSGAHADAPSDAPVISADGRYVAFTSEAALVPGDTNGVADVYLRDLRAGTTVRVSLTADGGQAVDGGSYAPTISADGRHVVFGSDAGNLVPGDSNGVADVFLRDLRAGTTDRVSLAADGDQPDDASYGGVLSRDSRFVAFASAATNLVPGDTNGVTDAFVHRLSR